MSSPTGRSRPSAGQPSHPLHRQQPRHDAETAERTGSQVPLDQPPTTETKSEPITSPAVAPPSWARSRAGWISSSLLLWVRAVLRGLLVLVLGLGGLFVVLAAITTLTDPGVRASSTDVPIAWAALVIGVGFMAACARLCNEAKPAADADAD